MKITLRLILILGVLPSFALAVYAPIPEQEQGKALTYRLGASVYHDSNIFGAATGKIASAVYNFSAGFSYNGSIDDQTFASASYDLSNDHVADRPGSKNLLSHDLEARLAHAFSSATNIDLSGSYNISKNPQSLLAGVALNTDQSFKRAQADAKFTTTAGEKTGLVAKYRFIDYAYNNATLANALDRTENLLGLEASFAYLPETRLVGEYRFQDIAYGNAGTLKDKTSHFLMAGFDYNPGKQVMVSARGGFEARKRDSAPDTTAPYLELTSRYAYSEGSFLAAGYTYTIEEPSDTASFTDSKTSRFFVNVQHRLSGPLTASGSLSYAPAQLQGRGTQKNVDENTTRFGLGLTWQPSKNWSVAGTYDYDSISSDLANREQQRSRFGVSANYTF